MRIQLKNLSVIRGGRVILNHICGDITNSCAILGTSGSGKSTLAMAILGMIPYSGEIVHDGLNFALVPQDPATALHPLKKISTLLGEMCSKSTHPSLLKSLGFSDPDRILNSYPHQLSGGMKQRVLIALALACKPDVIIADEPTSGLDINVQNQIVELLTSLNIPLLLITHDDSIAHRLCSQQLTLENGKVVHDGAPYVGV